MAAKHIQLFDLIKIMFTDQKKYDALGNIDKERNSFMVNRIMSIQYPMQAHLLSRNGIKGTHLVDFWQNIAKRHNRVPQWIYTKTKNNQTKTKPFKYKLGDPAVEWMMKRKEWSNHDWELNLRFNRDDLKKELDSIAKQITANQNV